MFGECLPPGRKGPSKHHEKGRLRVGCAKKPITFRPSWAKGDICVYTSIFIYIYICICIYYTFTPWYTTIRKSKQRIFNPNPQIEDVKCTIFHFCALVFVATFSSIGWQAVERGGEIGGQRSQGWTPPI